MKRTLIAAALAATLGFAGNARAEDRVWAWSPLGIGIAAPLQLPFTDSDIYGLRFGGLFGWNADVFGVDAGLVSLENGGLAGIQASAFSWTSGWAAGIQAAGIANVADENFYGLQTAPVNVDWGDVWGWQEGAVNVVNSLRGIQFGVFNWVNSTAYGWQSGAIGNATQEEFIGYAEGLVNYAMRMTGCQIGVVNLADEATGVQIGVFNAVERMSGVQIGVLNLICEGPVPFMVVANANF